MEIATEAIENTPKTDKSSEENNNVYSSSTVNYLSNGLLERYEPSLIKTKNELQQLTTKQTVLIEQLHNENLKISWSLASEEVIMTFNLIKQYHQKLINIKRKMKQLHERSFKLKKRALHLQQHKEKEMYLKNQQIQKEENLIGKPSTSNM